MNKKRYCQQRIPKYQYRFNDHITLQSKKVSAYAEFQENSRLTHDQKFLPKYFMILRCFYNNKFHPGFPKNRNARRGFK